MLAWKNGTITNYGTGIARTSVTDENSSGALIGYNFTGGGMYAAGDGWRTRNGGLEMLPELPGTFVSSPWEINDNGDIYGKIMRSRPTGGQETLYVRWPADRPAEVEVLPPLPKDAVPAAFDEDGTILLNFNGKQGTYKVGVWRNGVTTILPNVQGTSYTYATDISNGRAVGWSSGLGSQVNEGVYWDRDGNLHLLPDTSSVEAINPNGLIMATSDSDGNYHYFNSIWRLGAFDSLVGDGSTDNMYVLGGDDTIGGSLGPSGQTLPACGAASSERPHAAPSALPPLGPPGGWRAVTPGVPVRH